MAYSAAATWEFARTMPTIPHRYCLGEGSHVVGLGAGHEALFALIVDHGDDRWWRFKTGRSIEVDGFLYWVIEDGTVTTEGRPIGTCIRMPSSSR